MELTEKEKAYEPDIFDILGEEATQQINELGFSFLAEQGYDVAGAVESYDRAREIRHIIKARGQELRYRVLANAENGAVLFWYELYEGKDIVARSKGLKFVGKLKDES